MTTRYLTLTIIAALLMTAGASASDHPGLSPHLQQTVSDAADSLVEVIVFLDNDDVRSTVNRVASAATIGRDARIKMVSTELQNFRSRYADNVEHYLSTRAVGEVKPYWIVPAYRARVAAADLSALADLAGVRLIVDNAALILNEPVSITDAPALSTAVSSQLQQLKIPTLWSQGLKGEGRLICSFDTGVESTHPALSAKWRGNHVDRSAAWFSKVSPNTDPVDPRGHGTHTMGVMVGSTPADTFGVAPAAEWITAGVIDQTGRTLSATLADILEAFQWALNPDGNALTTDDVPDVILNSWGLPKGLFTPCDQTFTQAVANVEAAGIVTIFAAGNEGPDPSSLRYPADDATTPLSSFSVGAVDAFNVVASFSSRGPSSCNGAAMKPEVVAPGVAIRSSYKGGDYKYMSGTSMAAPYIAGLVALMRQYNPDASVDEIKTALIQSSSDLGPSGEDNAYGYGLPNAATVLDYLNPPTNPQLAFVSATISDDGVAMPGEQFGLQVQIESENDKAAVIEATLEVVVTGRAYVWMNSASYSFNYSPGIAAGSSEFTATVAPEIQHGDSVLFRLVMASSDSSFIDSLYFYIPVGVDPPGRWTTHQTRRIAMAVSDFGQHGLASGSIYNAGGAGFRIEGGGNLLYEAGFMVGRSTAQLSSSIRSENGTYARSDFGPVDSLTAVTLPGNEGVRSFATLRDFYSPTQIPLVIGQEVTSYATDLDSGLVIFRYELSNNTLERVDGLYFGFLCDFDLGDIDNADYNASLDMIYQYNGESYVGLVALSNMSSGSVLENTAGKTGYSRSEQLSLISGGSTAQSGSGDLMLLLPSNRLNIGANSTVEVAFAIVAGRTADDLVDAAVRARVRYDIATDVVSDANTALPDQFSLHQNYPNPFNPTTVIGFSLPRAGEVRLDVYNSLGRLVRTLHDGRLEAGDHKVEWDGTTGIDSPVASGVYFYRLSSRDQSHSKKMVLLK